MLRVALVGCGARGSNVYLPVLRKMTRHFRTVAVCDEREERADAAAAQTGAFAYYNLDRMLEECPVDLAVVAVTPPPSHLNALVGLKCLEAGVNLLAETPIAPTLDEADRMIAAARRTGARVEVGENYYRTPFERFKRTLIEAGVFGAVHVVYSDYVGHGYHGISLLRSYVGLGEAVARVTGQAQDYRVERHLYREGEPRRETETWQFGVLEFQNGARGVFSFSTLAYGSPLRWGREKCAVRFYAERGMGAGHDLAVLEDGERTRPLSIQTRETEVGGRPTLAAISSDLPSAPAWENPLRDYPLAHGDQHSELTVGLELFSIHRAITEGTEPEYGMFQARFDRRLDLAMSQSWSDAGAPVWINETAFGRAGVSLPAAV
jgi:predicted dehydrogenase